MIAPGPGEPGRSRSSRRSPTSTPISTRTRWRCRSRRRSCSRSVAVAREAGDRAAGGRCWPPRARAGRALGDEHVGLPDVRRRALLVALALGRAPRSACEARVLARGLAIVIAARLRRSSSRSTSGTTRFDGRRALAWRADVARRLPDRPRVLPLRRSRRPSCSSGYARPQRSRAIARPAHLGKPRRLRTLAARSSAPRAHAGLHRLGRRRSSARRRLAASGSGPALRRGVSRSSPARRTRRSAARRRRPAAAVWRLALVRSRWSASRSRWPSSTSS